ncbi:unnamed protein product [Mytilus coruscus]|uniref:Reverse transcriptase/retrotransposon-derived protein RNase H-like domain-containing protein n=1 Tax=Mytilus coruscus TaxID=42192 RepID=A0A6J8E233_MYTCO|nr:unnamed protein product [Mytilus coruscus]
MIVWGKVHNDILHGMQGICTNHNYLFKLGVLTAKAVVSVNKDKLVPVKLFNSTSEIVDIPRGQIVAKFEILDNDSDLIATCIGNKDNPEVNNVQFSTEKVAEIEPLTKLLRKNAKFRWTSEQENAFTKLKSLLINSPILAFPNFHTEFYLAVDTSSKGIGYMLYQYQETASDRKRVKFPNFMDSESTDFLEHNLPEVNNVMQSHDSIRNLKHFKRSKQFQNKQLDFGYDADTEDYDAADQTISKIKSQLPDYIKYQQFTDKCDSEDRNITADTGNRDIPETSSQNIDTENQSESVDHKTSAKNQDTEISTDKEDHSNFTTLNTDGDETQTNLSTETATSENNTQNKLPSSQKAARKLLLETPNYDMVDGLLFHTRTAKCKQTKLFTSYQLALPEVAIKTVLRLYHDSPLGGHGGIQHTADMLKEYYYFRNYYRV